jgi:hypothetical protein
MKVKKPLLVVALLLALIAVALVLPVTAFGANHNRPVNWVNGSYNTKGIGLPYDHIGFTVDVQQGIEPTDIEGFVLQKVMLASDPDFDDAPVVRRATEFVLEDPWRSFWSTFGLDPMYLDGYASFYGAGDNPGYGWSDFFPDIWFAPPTNPVDCDGANIADFVVSLDASFLPAPYTFDLWPHRYVILDFAEPGRADLAQIYGWVPIEEGFGVWFPLLSTGDLVPVPGGNFQVHVGED